MDTSFLAPLAGTGPSINRRTEENVQRAHLDIVDALRDGILRQIVAHPGGHGA